MANNTATCGLNKTVCPFKGDWFDIFIQYQMESRPEYRKIENKASYSKLALFRQNTITVRSKVTSVEDLVHEGTKSPNNVDMFNGKVLDPTNIVETIGLDYWYSKRIKTVEIDFPIEYPGVANLQATFEENEPYFKASSTVTLEDESTKVKDK